MVADYNVRQVATKSATVKTSPGQKFKWVFLLLKLIFGFGFILLLIVSGRLNLICSIQRV